MSPADLPPPEGVSRILVRATNWIGDIVMISPALAALRRKYPGARIELVAIPQVAPCLEGNPDVDEVLPFDRRGADAGVRGLLRLVRRLRERRYDMAVIFQKAMGAALTARLARIPVRIGLATDRRGWLLSHPVPFTESLARRHHLEIFSEVARAAGCDIRDPEPFFPLREADRDWAASFLRARDAGRFELLVALHVSASKRPRAWHLERFSEVALRIGRRHGAGIVLLGGRGDVGEMRFVAERVGERAINACGESTIGQMAALIARCRLFLGNDSGPMHVAGALGVPVVAIFGPGDPSRTAAWSAELHGRNGRPPGDPAAAGSGPTGRCPAVIPVTRRYPCAPCRQNFFRECYPAPSGKPMCLESIGVEEVEGAVERLLGAEPSSGSAQQAPAQPVEDHGR